MLVILRNQAGHRIEGLLLTMDETRMRVAIHRINETLEFRRVDELWFNEKGNFVEIESILFPATEPAVLKVGHA